MIPNTGRRDFLKNSAWMGAGAVLVGNMLGCRSVANESGLSPAVMGVAYEPIEKIRVGVIGIGGRGSWAVECVSQVPGVEVVAVSDLLTDRAEKAKKLLVKAGKKAPKLYAGSENAWKGLCDSPDVNLVYITSPWKLHTPMALYAMRAGKHAVSEVPIAVNLDECWELVETSEKMKRHCMLLENCCYGENELFALMLCRKGVLGTLVHGEGGYLHHNGPRKFHGTHQGNWRLKFSQEHTGNPYPTHGLGPICQYMGINRGDKMDYLSSISSKQIGLTEHAQNKYGARSVEANREYLLGDMNITTIRTHLGRTIMVQHDTTNPRPYSRINLIQGTKGVLDDYPLRLALGHEWMTDEQLAEMKKKYMHPLLKSSGERSKKVGGHGGMDFLMSLRLCYCLKNGLPLDIDVYDSVLWSSLVPLTEQSVLKRGASVEVPDFTRGAWRTTPPLGIVDIDYSKM